MISEYFAKKQIADDLIAANKDRRQGEVDCRPGL